MADKVAETFKEQDAERETQGAKQAKDDLANSIEELKKSISDEEAELIAFQKESNLPLADKGQELAASRLQGMSETWLKTMEARRQLEGRYNAAVQANDRGEGASIPELATSTIYQDAVRLSTERKAKLQDDIRSIEKQIQDGRDRAGRAAGQIYGGIFRGQEKGRADRCIKGDEGKDRDMKFRR